jgi:hypothetical protein
MMLARYVLPLVLLAFAATGVAGEVPAPTRNPFGVLDVTDPDGEDVQKFARDAAERIPAKADEDANAGAWSNMTLVNKPDSIEGPWSSRWNGGAEKWIGNGTAHIRIAKDRVYILYSDATGSYLVDAKRAGNTLVGRYVNINNPKDVSPFFGRIVDNTRIDGAWSQGRWDLRRGFGDKAKEVDIQLKREQLNHWLKTRAADGAC